MSYANLCISNLAWNVAIDAQVRDKVSQMGVKAVELAPTKIWPNLESVTDKMLEAYRSFWTDGEIRVVAFQSLLFGLPDVQILNATTHGAALERLTTMARLASHLGAEVLVFGSPKQRRRGKLSETEALQVARDFFGKAAELMKPHGVSLCLEANPTDYGCDFITTTDEAHALVQLVNHPNFCLHLDVACSQLAGEDFHKIFPRLSHRARHVHLTAPNLEVPPASSFANFKALQAEMIKNGYAGYFSFEYLGPQSEAAQLPTLVSVLQAMDAL